MTRTIAIALVGACLSAAPALAQSPFDGTWKADLATVKMDAKPDEVAIVDGVYSCASCLPAYSVPADGKPHKVVGHDYYDSKSVEVIDASTVRLTNLRAGKVVGVGTWTVSADGNTLNQSFSGSDTANGQAVTMTASERRLAPAPAGAHAISGSWAAAPASQMSDNAMSMTISTTGKLVTVSFPTGEHLTAVAGGPYVPVIGDHAGQEGAILLRDPQSLDLSYRHKGVVDEVDTLVVGPSGNTLVMTSVDKRQGATTTLTMRKQ